MSKNEIEIVAEKTPMNNHKGEKESNDRKLLCQWIIDLIALNDLLNIEYNRWYQQLFYIKLVGLFEYVSYATAKYEYFTYVQKCINEMYNSLTNEEFAFIVYQRHTCAHIKLDAYELYDSNGQLNIISKAFTKKCNEHQRKEQVNRTEMLDDIRNTLNNAVTVHSLDLTLRNKIFLSIKKLEKGLNAEIQISGLAQCRYLM